MVIIRILLRFELGSDRNFGSGFGRFWQVRFGKNFAELFVIQFHAHLQYAGIKWTDYAVLCNKSFSHSAKFHNTYLDNSVIRRKTFDLLRGRILYSQGPRHRGHRGHVPPCSDPSSRDKGTHLVFGSLKLLKPNAHLTT